MEKNKKTSGKWYDYKAPDKLPKYLNKTEISEILDKARLGKYRNYILILTMVRTGIRVSEVVNLRKKDIQEDTILVRQGKGKKDRVIPLEPHLKDILRLYTDNFTRNRKLFDITTRQVQFIVKKYNPDLHPHMLRHSFAVNCLKSGMNLRNLQKILGHTSLATTQVYLDVTATDVLDDFTKVEW